MEGALPSVSVIGHLCQLALGMEKKTGKLNTIARGTMAVRNSQESGGMEMPTKYGTFANICRITYCI